MSLLRYSIAIVILLLASCSTPADWHEPFPERLTISVTDSIGMEMGDSCYVLGAIADAEVSPSGTILVLDKSAHCIREFASDGTHLTNLSRHGNGPGEFAYPFDMALMPDGEILVADMFKQAIVVLSETGESIEDISDWSLFLPTSITPLGEGLFAGCEMKYDMTDNHMLIIINPSLFRLSDGTSEYSFFSDTLMFNLDGSDTPLSAEGLTGVTLMCSGEDGGVFYSRKSSSEGVVHCWDIEGSPLFTASIGIPPVRKTEQEILDEIEFTGMQFAALGLNTLPEDFEPDPLHNLVENIGVDPDGNLWVQRGTEPQPVFDVFDTAGDHIGTAEFPRTGKQWQFSITPNGSLAWNNDPLSGIQKIYMIELPEVSQ
ncbi:MAG: hypothetical protein KAH31_10545 [Candidatus Sabulitectum sp.]|nr:hypothetical protein [Candidatus Sabulitectum sp.]